MKKSKIEKSNDKETLEQDYELPDIEGVSKKALHERIALLQSSSHPSKKMNINDHLTHELQVHEIELEMQNRALREAQSELEITRDRYADIYDFAPINYISFNDKGVIKNINITGTKILGKVRASLIEQPLISWVVPEDIDVFYRHLRATLNADNKVTNDIKINGPKGSILNTRFESVRYWHNEIGAYLCQSAIIDLTDYIQSQEKVTLQARQLKLITNSLPLLIAYLNDSGDHLFANKSYIDLLDVLPENIIGMKVSDLWKERSYAILNSYLKISFRGQQVCFDMEISQKDNDKKYFNITLVPDFDTEDNVHGVIMQLRDITEKMHDEVLNRQRLLDSAHFSRLSAMGEMASEIAHELNQPLAAISTYSAACRRMIESNSIQPEEIVQTLKDIGEQAERAGQVIQRIRSFTSKNELKLEQASCNELVDESLQLLKVELRSHHIKLRLNMMHDMPLIYSDKILVEQVIINLARNAVEAMDDIDESIRILKIHTDTLNTNEIIVSIEDSGPGISNSELNDIFTPFHTTKEYGMGMGLSICRSIIEAHQGRLWATSSDHGGTIFNFSLPVASCYVQEDKHDK